MLIRCRGYNKGVKEYLEEGQKAGRELTRDELDERVILDGNLDLTDMVYKSIPDRKQDRYLTFTLSFKEEDIESEKLTAITNEFKAFLMKAYSPDEFNFYAEAHIPKVKTQKDKKTGEIIDRKPHIHIVIPRKNLLTGNEMNPVGNYKQNEKYFEAFQEYINQKYKLESPRDNMRATPTDYADVLSRYKGDDFRAKNKDFKKEILERIHNENLHSRQAFYDMVSQYGETRIRNKGKSNEYIAVKLEGDKKFTNLKETIFTDDFIVNRKISKPPLDPKVIKSRFAEWDQRAYEIKYIDKIASPTLRDKYYSADGEVKKQLLHQVIYKFDNKYRGSDELRSKPAPDNQRRTSQAKREFDPTSSYRLQNLPHGNVAGSRWREGNKVLLQGNARLHMANEQTNRDTGLRRAIPNGGRGDLSEQQPKGSDSSLWRNTSRDESRLRSVGTSSGRRHKLQLTPYPVIPRLKNKIPTLDDIHKRGDFLFSAGTISRYTNSPVFIKPSLTDASSSSVPAWLIRRMTDKESSQKSINKLLRTVDRDFYDIKKEVLSDNRFSYQEKNQLLSIMHFERLKRKDAILNKKEVLTMGSKDIRDLINNTQKDTNALIITAPEPEEVQPSKSRFNRVAEKLRSPVNYAKVADESRKSVEKHLDASNLYTKRTKKGHVHYLDKTSDKTLFVDDGKLITMRKNGLSKDSVAVALELAQGRFGSTLNIKGSQKFKDMVINVAAEKGLDIHFTDKKMNEALALRRQELANNKENSGTKDAGSAFTIEGATPQPETPKNVADIEHILSNVEQRQMAMTEEQKLREFNTPEDKLDAVKAEINAEIKARLANADVTYTASTKEPARYEGEIVKHGVAPYLNQEGNSSSYYVTLKDKAGQETTHWGVGLKDALAGFRRGHEVALELKETKPVQVRTRDENGKVSVREAVRNSWEATRLDGPQPKSNDVSKGFQVVNAPADKVPTDFSKGFRMVNNQDNSPDFD